MTTFKKIREIFSWFFLILMLFTFIFVSYNLVEAKKNGEGYFLFGYRPVLILTGSMEPYMMTNSLAMTKEVTSLDQLEIGDVVTYHVDTESGNTLRITHRIVAIDNEKIYTKGDNNNVIDGYPLTIENIEAKVIGVTNITAEIASIWQNSLSGKIFLICFGVGILLMYYSVKYAIASAKQRRHQIDADSETGDKTLSDHAEKDAQM